MKVSRERLSVIGRMIGIYREERRGNTQNSWTQLKFCEDICSPNTLKNIESGGIARSQELYEKLLEKLDLKLGEFPVIDEAVQDLIDKLYVAIEFFDNTEIDSLTAKGIKVLEKAKDYIFYSELYEIFEDLRNYYLDDIIVEDARVNRYLIIKDLFDPKLKDLLKLIVFARIKMSSIGDLSVYEDFIKQLELDTSDYSCIKINLLHYYYITRQRFLMIETLEWLEQKFELQNNLNRLVDVYSFAIVMFSDIDDIKSKEYLAKADVLLQKNVLSNAKCSEINANIATYYYNQKDYSKSLEYFPKAVQYNHPNLLTNCIVMANCQSRLNLSINIPSLTKKELKNYPNELRIMYQYFHNAQTDELPAFMRQKMIMKYIAPILQDPISINIFRFELNKIVEETNAYKILYLFDKMMEDRLI